MDSTTFNPAYKAPAIAVSQPVGAQDFLSFVGEVMVEFVSLPMQLATEFWQEGQKIADWLMGKNPNDAVITCQNDVIINGVTFSTQQIQELIEELGRAGISVDIDDLSRYSPQMLREILNAMDDWDVVENKGATNIMQAIKQTAPEPEPEEHPEGYWVQKIKRNAAAEAEHSTGYGQAV